MSASPDRAAYMRSKQRLTTRGRERKMTVDLVPCMIRDSRHRFLFTVKHWMRRTLPMRNITIHYSPTIFVSDFG
jgi:hypothetical protein